MKRLNEKSKKVAREQQEEKEKGRDE